MSRQLTTPGVQRLRRRTRICAALLLLLAAGAAAAQQAPAGPKEMAAVPDAPQASPSGQPYRVGGSVSPPKLISRGTNPAYTETARRSRVTGVVILEAVIDEQGDVTNTRVLKGLPRGLDRAAVEAVATWKFEPATLEGKPVQVYYVLTVNFQLDGPAYQGPLFTKYIQEHPDFGEALRLERYDEAAALLDGSPGDPGTGLARIYLLLHQARLADAWQAARSHAGTGRSELLRAVTAFAQQIAQNSRHAATRAEALALGLEVADVALDEEPDAFEVLLDKSLLLRKKAERAATAGSDAEAKKLRAEADRLRALAEQMRKARGTAESEGDGR
jgi:TonB family protein